MPNYLCKACGWKGEHDEIMELWIGKVCPNCSSPDIVEEENAKETS